MKPSVIELIIKAKDQASRVVEKSSNSLAKLNKSMGASLTTGLKWATVAGGAIAGTALLIGKRLLAVASDAQEMKGKFDVVFGKFGSEITEELEKFSNVVGRNKYELMGFASSIQDTLVPLGFARGAASKMSVEMTKLAVDLASFNNIAEDEALATLQSAIVGNTEGLLKFGIVAQQAQIEQEALNLKVWDGTGKMTAQAKASAIMSLAVKGSSDAMGDAERTSDGWANTMRRLKSSFQEAQVEMGEKLLPVLSPLLIKFADLADVLLPRVIDGFSNLVTSATPYIERIFNTIEVNLMNSEGFWDEYFLWLKGSSSTTANWISSAFFNSMKTIQLNTMKRGFWEEYWTYLTKRGSGVWDGLALGIWGLARNMQKAIEWVLQWWTKLYDKISTGNNKLGSFVAGLVGGKKKNAMGTNYFSGGLTEINERGSESIILPRGSKIMSAEKTKAMSNQNSVNVVINEAQNFNETALVDLIMFRLNTA